MLAGVRQQLIARRTQLSNAIRGYAAEYGLTAAKGLDKIEPLLTRIAVDEALPVLARELSLNPLRCLLAAQPTRGLDVGAVEAVYAAIRRVCERGVGVLLVSSELDELLAVAHRVLVIYRGRIIGEVPGGSEQQEAVGRLMSGQTLSNEEPS